MSTKQLRQSVRHGRKITVTSAGTTITGYLCGMDDFHLMVIEPDGRKHLVHKVGTIISLADESTYDSEPNKDALDRVIGPFLAVLTKDQPAPTRHPARQRETVPQ